MVPQVKLSFNFAASQYYIAVDNRLYESNTPRGGIGVCAYLVPYKFFSKKQVSADSEKTICKVIIPLRD